MPKAEHTEEICSRFANSLKVKILMRTDTQVPGSPSADKQRRNWMLSTAAVAGLAGAGVAWWQSKATQPLTPEVDAFWRMQFDQPAGAPLNMQSFQGQALLVNFWATWCPPCVEELPLLESIWREKSVNRLQVVGLAVDQPSSVRNFLEKNQLTFPIGLAGLTGTALARSLGNSVSALPFSILFDSKGQIRAQKMGKLEANELSVWIQSLK